MRVLVTRPEPGGGQTAARLRKLGHVPVVLPLFECVCRNPDPAHIGRPAAAYIATSANAVRSLQLLSNGGEEWQAMLSTPFFAVGPATAKAARELGFARIIAGPGSGKELAGLLVEEVVSGRVSPSSALPAIYLAGVPRSAEMESVLVLHAIAFEVVELYEMAEISYATDYLVSVFFSSLPDCVLVYSANAAKRLGAIFGPENLSWALANAKFHCLSVEIVASLPPQWRNRAIVAEAPQEESLLATLGPIR